MCQIVCQVLGIRHTSSKKLAGLPKMKKFIIGFVAGAICSLTAYFIGPLRKVEQNARIGGFIAGAHLALMAVDDELTDAVTADDGPVAPHMEKAIRHIRSWRGCGIVGFSDDWPGAYERLQAIEQLHPGGPGWHAHIAASCSAADLGDTK